jgi:tetratricopeptide (TPR) repeat protein
MSIEPDLLDEIERYLRHEQSPAEKEAFEKRMKQDPSLAQEVENHRTAIFLIKVGAVQTMKKRLEGYSTYNTSPTKKIFAYKWYIGAAAAFTALTLVIRFLLPHQTDTNKLFAAYFQAPSADRQILRDNTEVDEKTKAFISYERGHYKESLRLYEKILKEQSSDELLFYAGAAALADDQSLKAIGYFTELLKNSHSLYRSRTQWYLSLAYLKEGQLKKTTSLLNTLVKQPNSYEEKARKLLHDLN